MRVKITRSKNCEHYSIIYDIKINGKRTSKVFENIGNYDKLKLRAGDQDPLVWLNDYVAHLNKKHRNDSLPVIIKKNPSRLIDKNVRLSFDIGYLFLQDLYYKLGLNDICNSITDRYQFKFDLNDILSKLIYSRILFPASKLKTLELSKKFLEQPSFEYQHIERALPVLCKENDFIQSQLYKNSKKYEPRNNRILYYDCTNFFLKLNAKMTSGSMENQKKTDLILSFKWDCLWMAMASLYAAKLLPATRTSRQHCSRWKKRS